jgi:small subunit ribosomal protein S16
MIRLKRVGRRNQASFRLVVTPKTSGSHAEPIEFLGFWNPHTKESNFKKERILYWLGKGAKLSDSANNLLVKLKIIAGKKIVVHKKAKSAPAPKEGEAHPALVKRPASKESEEASEKKEEIQPATLTQGE